MPFVWLRCRSCQGPLFADEGQRGTCFLCVRRAALRLDWLYMLGRLMTARPGVVRRVNILAINGRMTLP